MLKASKEMLVNPIEKYTTYSINRSMPRTFTGKRNWATIAEAPERRNMIMINMAKGRTFPLKKEWNPK